jgi:hypothetical protein
VACLVRGTFLRIADVRSQPANISVAASRSTPSRRVVPSPKLPDRHHHSAPTATTKPITRSSATGLLSATMPSTRQTVALTGRSISVLGVLMLLAVLGLEQPADLDVDKLAVTTKRVQAAGGARRCRVRDRRRAARRRAHQVALALRSRTGQAKQVVFEVTRQVACLTQAQLADARRVVASARRSLARGRIQPAGRLRAVVQELQTTIQRGQRLLDQAHIRLGGGMPDGASRLVSLHDPDARAIRKGRLGQPVEFGYKAQVIDNADGIVLDHQVMMGNPPDAPLLVPAIEWAIARTPDWEGATGGDRRSGL